MNKVDLFKNIKQEQNSVMVKILEQDIEIRKQSLQELAEIEYVVMQILLDEDTKSYNAHLYDFVIDIKILEYFTNINLNGYKLEDLYKLLNTDSGKAILKEVKEHILIKEQIEQLYNNINKQIEYMLNKFNNTNEGLNQFLISANSLIMTLNRLAEVHTQTVENANLVEFVDKLSNIDGLTKKELVDTILEHNKGVKPNRAIRRASNKGSKNSTTKEKKDNIVEIELGDK